MASEVKVLGPDVLVIQAQIYAGEVMHGDIQHHSHLPDTWRIVNFLSENPITPEESGMWLSCLF